MWKWLLRLIDLWSTTIVINWLILVLGSIAIRIAIAMINGIPDAIEDYRSILAPDKSRDALQRVLINDEACSKTLKKSRVPRGEVLLDLPTFCPWYSLATGGFSDEVRDNDIRYWISPPWCELQYWYALTKHGNKRRRPATMDTRGG